MCLLTFFPNGVMPDTDALLNGTFFNDDGHGFAIVDKVSNKIIVERGMDAKEMVYTFAHRRSVMPDGPAMFHSRLATDGLINLLNTHPFPVGGDPRTVLAHNGIMPLRPSKGDPRSDTRIVAEQHIPRAFGTLRRRRARMAFERWMGSWNKAVILTVDSRFRGNAFLLNEKAGIWTEDGIWYSNDAYKPFQPIGTIRPTGGWSWEQDAEPEEGSTMGYITCWGCQRKTSNWFGECVHCGLCFDCNEPAAGCFCWSPARLDQKVP
jgi:hypothetical protein